MLGGSDSDVSCALGMLCSRGIVCGVKKLDVYFQNILESNVYVCDCKEEERGKSDELGVLDNCLSSFSKAGKSSLQSWKSFMGEMHLNREERERFFKEIYQIFLKILHIPPHLTANHHGNNVTP